MGYGRRSGRFQVLVGETEAMKCWVVERTRVRELNVKPGDQIDLTVRARWWRIPVGWVKIRLIFPTEREEVEFSIDQVRGEVENA